MSDDIRNVLGRPSRRGKRIGGPPRKKSGAGSDAGTPNESGPSTEAVLEPGGLAVRKRTVAADRLMAQPVEGWASCVSRSRRAPEYVQLCDQLAGTDAVPDTYPPIFVTMSGDAPPSIVSGTIPLVAAVDMDITDIPVLEVDKSQVLDVYRYLHRLDLAARKDDIDPYQLKAYED